MSPIPPSPANPINSTGAPSCSIIDFFSTINRTLLPKVFFIDLPVFSFSV
ncbi:MAG: hypothetical protein JW913_18705 [Chitinispirillaceae bacterium]|nr:hypothetical protein [Chitinispirillaceae bacterium]